MPRKTLYTQKIWFLRSSPGLGQRKRFFMFVFFQNQKTKTRIKKGNGRKIVSGAINNEQSDLFSSTSTLSLCLAHPQHIPVKLGIFYLFSIQTSNFPQPTVSHCITLLILSDKYFRWRKEDAFAWNQPYPTKITMGNSNLILLLAKHIFAGAAREGDWQGMFRVGITECSGSFWLIPGFQKSSPNQ